MELHAHTPALAREQKESVIRNNLQAMKIVLPSYPQNKDPVQFHNWVMQQTNIFFAVQLGPIVAGTITRDGPDPAPNYQTHAQNQATFDLANRGVASIICRSLTTGGSIVDIQGVDSNNGVLLWTHLVNLNTGVQAHKIDNTFNEFASLRQKQTESAHTFFSALKVRRGHLVTANMRISDNMLHQSFLRGAILPESTINLLKLHTEATETLFWTNVEKLCDPYEMPKQPESNDRKRQLQQGDQTCYNCGKPGHNLRQCTEAYDQATRDSFFAAHDYNSSSSSSTSTGGKGKGNQQNNSYRGGGNKGGGKGYGKGGGRNNNGGYGGDGGRGPYRQNLQSALSTIANLMANQTTSQTSTQPPAPPPAGTTTQQQVTPANQQAAETLLEDILNGWNGHISDQCNAIISDLILEAASAGLLVVYWLFDPGCGSHISNIKRVFILDAPQACLPTTGMFTAQGYPMPAQFEGTTTCGFRQVKYIPTCNLPIFSKPHSQRQGMKTYLDSDADVFSVVDPSSGKTFLFPNIGGMHFYRDEFAMIAEKPVVQSVESNEPELGMQVYMASRTRAVYEFLLIHQRLNHLNFQYLWNYLSQGILKDYRHNLKHVDVRLLPACQICKIWKKEHQTLVTTNSPPCPPRPGMVIAADLKKFNKNFYGQKNTVVVFVDYHSTSTSVTIFCAI